MKSKLLSILLVLFIGAMSCFADILPRSVSDIPKSTLGLYQTDSRLIIYEKPNKESNIIIDKIIDYKHYTDKKDDSIFAVMIPQKELGYLYVTDTSDDEEWVQVIYDKNLGRKGWVYKNDDYQFMTWGLFFNLYGMKYGLYKLNNSPLDINVIYSAPETTAQKFGKYTHPKHIHLTTIEGSWMLVSILDVSNETMTGYIQWRTDGGQIILFPDIK